MNLALFAIVLLGVALIVASIVVSRRGRKAEGTAVAEAPGGSSAQVPAPAPSSRKFSDVAPVPAMPKLEAEEVDCDVTDVFQMPGEDTSIGAMVKNEYLPKFYDERAGEDTKTSARELFLLVGSARTDRGLVRQGNEDAVLTMPEHGVFAVADGMGGHELGEVASHLAVTAVQEAITSPATAEAALGAGPEGAPIPVPSRVVAGAMKLANDRVYAEARVQTRKQRMGTTLVVAHFATKKRRLAVGHVGDSRIYRLRAGELVRLSTDHTLGEMGIPGPMAGRLSRAVGIGPAVRIDLMLGVPMEGDVYLLCTDGLTRSVNDTTLASILGANTNTPPQQVVDELVNLANERGGRDNISAVVIRVEESLRAS